MKQYNLINRCLSTLKSSRMDVMTKLRMEKLLSGITMPVSIDVQEQQNAAEFEELFRHVNEVCSGASTDGVKGLVKHIRRMQTSMTACFNPTC